MSVKHIKEYYEEIAQQYKDMLNEIKDFEKEVEKKLIEPERLDKIKESIQPLMNNYQTLSYIMYLLQKPNKIDNQKVYDKRKQKFLSTINEKFTEEGLLKENKEVIKNLKQITGEEN